MYKQCPNCKGLGVRRVSRRGGDILVRLRVYSPYRCEDCSSDFRKIGARFRNFSIVIGVTVLVASLVALMSPIVLTSLASYLHILAFN